MPESPLTTADRFEIFEQMNLHQQAIDQGFSREAALKYVDLYWPEATFTVNDLRHVTFEGPKGLKRMYDYAHSVFPIDKWSHSMGPFSIRGAGDEATGVWRWVVSWREDNKGVVSTGTYHDRWQRRDGIWKCIERTSDIDGNWPAELFQPYVDKEQQSFRES
jgi:hypothetical protein